MDRLNNGRFAKGNSIASCRLRKQREFSVATWVRNVSKKNIKGLINKVVELGLAGDIKALLFCLNKLLGADPEVIEFINPETSNPDEIRNEFLKVFNKGV
jgi:hypothetical protein